MYIILAMSKYSDYHEFVASAITMLGGFDEEMNKKIWVYTLKSYFEDKEIDKIVLCKVAHSIAEEYNYYGDFMERSSKDLIESIDSVLHLDPNDLGSDEANKVFIGLREYFEKNIAKA